MKDYVLPGGPAITKTSLPLTLILDGTRFSDIGGFYDEVNRVFMVGEDWQLGQSLDALNDMLYGGYGALKDGGPVTLCWHNMEASRQALGVEATLEWLASKLALPERFNAGAIEKQIANLEVGTGQTYFEIIQAIFGDHPNICLKPG